MYTRGCAVLLVWLLVVVPVNAAGSPLKDAVAMWHFADQASSAQRHSLLVHGTVTLGVPLDGEEREASLAARR